jgi:hypothetical protein
MAGEGGDKLGGGRAPSHIKCPSPKMMFRELNEIQVERFRVSS